MQHTNTIFHQVIRAVPRHQGNRIKTVTFPLAVFPNNHYPIVSVKATSSTAYKLKAQTSHQI